MTDGIERIVSDFGVLGLNYRSECFSNSQDSPLSFDAAPRGREATLRAVKKELGLDELLPLQTCNRVELFFVTSQPIDNCEDNRVRRLLELLGSKNEIASELHILRGEAAIQYFFEITAALDSMVIGEAQILGQLRRAVDSARAEGHFGPRLEEIFARALRIARRIRQETGIGRGRLSLFSLVVDDVRSHLSSIMNPTVVFLGAGEMIEKIAELLSSGESCACGEQGLPQSTKMYFVNRTFDRAFELSRRFGGKALSFESLRSEPYSCDLIITATSSPKPILDCEFMQALAPPGSCLLVIDLAHPGDVASNVASLSNVTVVGMPELKLRAEVNKRQRLVELERGKSIIKQGLKQLRREAERRRLARMAPVFLRHLEADLRVEQAIPWAKSYAPLLIRRAHKVLMSELGERCDNHRSCGASSSHEDDIRVTRRALASPEALDRKTYRNIDVAERQALEHWFNAQAVILSRRVAELLAQNSRRAHRATWH